MRNEIARADLQVWAKGPSSWHGRLITHGNVSAVDFRESDVAEVIASATSGDEWDGTEAALLRLYDGRFASYETFYGPTGSGFSEDAYGGDADIHFGPDLATVVRWGLTDEGRDLLGIILEDGLDISFPTE